MQMAIEMLFMIHTAQYTQYYIYILYGLLPHAIQLTIAHTIDDGMHFQRSI